MSTSENDMLRERLHDLIVKLNEERNALLMAAVTPSDVLKVSLLNAQIAEAKIELKNLELEIK